MCGCSELEKAPASNATELEQINVQVKEGGYTLTITIVFILQISWCLMTLYCQKGFNATKDKELKTRSQEYQAFLIGYQNRANKEHEAFKANLTSEFDGEE